jgi:hypothetical protein
LQHSGPPSCTLQVDPKTVGKQRGAKSPKTPERIYHVYLLGLLHGLRRQGWQVHLEARAGSGYVDIRLVSQSLRTAVLIELKSSEKHEWLAKDVDDALIQIVTRNYRNHYRIREYGMANFHLQSVVKGRYMIRTREGWAERDDPAK